MSEQLAPPNLARVRSTTPRTKELVTLPVATRLVRVHPLGGPHPNRWDEYRSWGPTKSRFDHHPPPRRTHPTRRIAYAAQGDEAFTAALAEYFQDDSGGVAPFDLTHRRPAVSIFKLAAPVTLLDLDSGWVTRAGGNQAIRTGPRGRSRAWARAIYRAHPDVAGLAYGSSVWGPGRCAALWERAEAAMPSLPIATRTLDDPGLTSAIARSAEELETYVL